MPYTMKIIPKIPSSVVWRDSRTGQPTRVLHTPTSSLPERTTEHRRDSQGEYHRKERNKESSEADGFEYI